MTQEITQECHLILIQQASSLKLNPSIVLESHESVTIRARPLNRLDTVPTEPL